MDGTAQRMLAAQKAGFPTPQLVAEDYTIVNGAVRPVGLRVARSYWPILVPELPSAVAELADADDDDVLRFARHYGLLGLSFLRPNHEHRRIVDEMAGAAQEELRLRLEEEPLEWIRAHGNGVRIAMMGLYAASNEDEDTALAFVSERLDGKVIRWGLVAEGYEVVELSTPVDYLDGWVALHQLALVAADIVNRNLAGVRRRLTVTYHRPPGGPQRPRLHSTFTALGLISIVYWMVADEAGGGRWRRCAECGAPFVALDLRQRFCPPTHGGRESRCAMRHRQREYRLRKAQKEG